MRFFPNFHLTKNIFYQENTISVKWNEVVGATYYIIMKSDDLSGDFQIIGDSIDTTMTDSDISEKDFY